ncbi:phosphatase PAP2 family protein [Novosphingobium sp. G106]|uniref:phosphatase PAP2 family protein n=1 Tax=Novosphingobium sp. G106 TaxID=2849500 RepID=UPI001C2CD5D5|nr:phosphatase PAP2 family protein [Novosphingobium sp. G106]MBV1690133.1 phosphatase PAP2 family protein [Novosphingobium sp. G106]MBV1690750.1 phosphatase PAP2 family protein [Novosphingobium sp. G106]
MWLFALCGVALFLATGFRVTSNDWLERLVIIVIGGCLAALLKKQPTYCVAIAGTAFFQGIVISTAAMMVTYAAATSGNELADEALLRMDRALGYDWQAYASFIYSHETLTSLVLPSYWLIFPQPILIICLLAAKGRADKLEKFIIVSALTLCVTAAIFYFLPATQAWTHLGYGDDRIAIYPDMSHSSHGWVQQFLKIHGGGGRVMSHFTGGALIAFPSYHCISGLIFIWATWPIAVLRPTSVIFNGLMIAATPIVGGHYLVDIIGGALVAAAVIGVTERFYPRLCRFAGGDQNRPERQRRGGENVPSN